MAPAPPPLAVPVANAVDIAAPPELSGWEVGGFQDLAPLTETTPAEAASADAAPDVVMAASAQPGGDAQPTDATADDQADESEFGHPGPAALLARGSRRGVAVEPPPPPKLDIHPLVHGIQTALKGVGKEVQDWGRQVASREAAGRVMQAVNGVVFKKFPQVVTDVTAVREALAHCLKIQNATSLSVELQEKMATDEKVALEVVAGAANQMLNASKVRDEVQAEFQACRQRCYSMGKQVEELRGRLENAAEKERLLRTARRVTAVTKATF